jgi:hypothetical protein
LSPEVLEKKRKLMNQIRESRLDRLRELCEIKKEQEAGEPTGTSAKQPKNS